MNRTSPTWVQDYRAPRHPTLYQPRWDLTEPHPLGARMIEFGAYSLLQWAKGGAR